MLSVLRHIEAPARLAALTRLASIAAGLALVLIVSGNLTRNAGPGVSCSTWPLCFDQALPVPNAKAALDLTHRGLSMITGAAIVALAALAFVWRADAPVRKLSLIAVGLMLAQVLLGAVIVLTRLPPTDVALHLAAGYALLGVLAAVPLLLTLPTADTSLDNKPTGRARSSFATLAGLVFFTLITGGIVSGQGAALACGTTWPLCNGGLLPNGGPLVFAQWAHRTLSVLLLVHAVMTTGRVLRANVQADGLIRRSARWVQFGFLAQVVLGIALVLSERAAVIAALHSALGALTWLASLILAIAAARLPLALPEPVRKTPAKAKAEVPVWRQKLGAYVALTKPRVISLLLLTTIAAMFITPAGAPKWQLVLWTFLGGFCMAGAANAVNMWYDSDIDKTMGRTKLRPIPSGLITPNQALAFGFGMFALSLTIFTLFVNVAAAALAVVGFVYYTVIYTHWLKRSTWQNIVIGGGAGAIPPLIGWAAASGGLTWGALMLFFIIFYWTPPHFWALALMKRKDYAAAGVPMLPVVAGDVETSRQIVIYTFGMIALSVVIVPMGMMGGLYLWSALLLGGVFAVYAIRAHRDRSPENVWGLYKYSLIYLALLFLAMVVDRLAQ
jgi:heme o synthase